VVTSSCPTTPIEEGLDIHMTILRASSSLSRQNVDLM
jgi:hypothetical protein